MDIKNVIKNVTPSVTVMAIGLVGAYFVYNTYFSDRVATGFAGFEPAAGEEKVVTEAELEADASVEDDRGDRAMQTMEDAAKKSEEVAEETEESMDEAVEEGEEMAEEAEESMEEEIGEDTEGDAEAEADAEIDAEAEDGYSDPEEQ